MSVRGNFPTFKYITVENLVITHNGTPYPVKNFYTNKKYVVWNVERQYQLEDTNIRPENSLLEYLVVINDNGKPTIVNHDELTYSFDQLTTGGSSSGEYNALKEKVDANTKKYNTISNTVDGMTQIIGSTEELKDGSIIYNLNKVKSDSKSYGVQIEEIKTKIDDKYKELRPILLSSLVEYLRTVSEYKLSFTDLKEDIEITSDELNRINNSKTDMMSKLELLNANLDSLIGILEEVNDSTNIQTITNAKSQLSTLHNALISLGENALLNNKLEDLEKTNIIQKAYELTTYVGTVQNTCNNITVNGLGGVIYSVENELLMLKDSTTSSIKELNRNGDDLEQKYTNVKQTTESIAEEVGQLTNKVGDLSSTSKKTIRSVVTYYTLSSSNSEIVGYDFSNIKPGDIIFQGNKDNDRYKGVYHVSIFYGLHDGENYVIECTSKSDVKKHKDGKTCGLCLRKWENVKKSDIVCIARPNSSSANRVFNGASEFLTLAKAYYDKREQYFTYSQYNLWTDNSSKSWIETTTKGIDSPDGLYRHLDCSGYVNLVMRGIPFEEVFTNESVFNARDLSKRTNYTWTNELPRLASEQCQEVENLGWDLRGSELHSVNNQWYTSVPENPNNFYIWSKNITTYVDGTTLESEITCLSNDLALDGRSIVDTTPYYYESSSNTETIDGNWTTIPPRWTGDKYVWTKSLILYDDDTNDWTPAVCVGGTSPISLTLDATSYVVAYDSYNIPKSNENITLTATQTNFDDEINWFVSPNTVALSGTGKTRTISPDSFKEIDKVSVTIQSKALSNTIMIVKVKDGAKGQDGTSVKILGSYETEEKLNLAHPSGNELGDGYMVGKDLYVWNGSRFENVGQIKGEDGVDGKSSRIHIKYSNDGGNTFTPNNGEDIGEYIGTCVDYDEIDPSSVSAYKWAKFLGDKGEKGDTGNGVENIVIQYAKNQSTTVEPTSGWSTNIPTYEKGYYLWYRTRTKYTNNTDYVYSTATCDISWKSVGDILDIIGDWSSTETISESFSNVTKKVDSITQEVKRNSRVSQFRYIRDYVNGNTVNNGSHWVEIQVYKDNTNIAKGKNVTCSGTGVNLNRITDGSITSGYAEVTEGIINTSNDLNGYKYVQVDLGQVYTNIQKIKIWHYYDDNRAYYHKLEVSKDGNEWFRFFDSDKNGLYQETVKGKTYIIDDSYSESQFEQTADKFSWIIKSGISSSSMVFTDDFYSVITENIRLKAKNISLEGLVTANSKFKILTDGSMEATSGKFSGSITGGSININNIFKVNTSGKLTATGADIGGKITITDGSISLNNGAFVVSSLGNTKIGGDSPCTVNGYARAKCEITSNGNIYVCSSTDSEVYTYFEEGKFYQHGTEGTVSITNGQVKISDGSTATTYGDGFISHNLSIMVDTPILNCTQSVYASEFRGQGNCVMKAPTGSGVYLLTNGASIGDNENTNGVKTIRYFKNTNGDYVFRTNSLNGSCYNGTSSYPWKQVAAKEFNNTSDRTLKENIVYLSNSSNYSLKSTQQLTVDDLYNFVKNDLPITMYNYIDDDSKKIGFIAQDIIYNADETDNIVGQLIVNPRAWNEEEGKLTYDVNNYISVLAGALQMAMKKIDILEGKINGN